MSEWCVESYPSSLYKFEIFSKLVFLAFCRHFWPWSGGSKSMHAQCMHRLQTVDVCIFMEQIHVQQRYSRVSFTRVVSKILLIHYSCCSNSLSCCSLRCRSSSLYLTAHGACIKGSSAGRPTIGMSSGDIYVPLCLCRSTTNSETRARRKIVRPVRVNGVCET